MLRSLKSYNLYALLLVVFVFSIFTSCDRSGIYDQAIVMEDDTWHRENILEFNVKIIDSIHPNDFYIQLRNTTDYKFSNLYFFLDTKFPNGDIIRDTIQCFLAEPDGKWLGEGMGKIKSNRILLRKNVLFPTTGNYLFRFEQAMRVVELEGILDFGLRIEKSEPVTD